MTPFSRLLIFLLFFIPTAYVGASYFNGEDPIANIKGMLGMNDAPQTEQSRTAANDSEPATFENVQGLRKEIARLKLDLAVAEEKLARCQAEDVE